MLRRGNDSTRIDGNPARGHEAGVRMNGISGMHGVKLFTGAAVSVLLLALAGPTPALADTIEAALVRAYQNNPQLNAQRAQVRSTDENVPQALSGYRPRVSLTGERRLSVHGHPERRSSSAADPRRPALPRSAGLTVNQTLLQRQPDRQQDARRREPGLRRPRGVAQARADACSSRRPRPTWTICATPPRSKSSAATCACSSRR